MTVSVIIVNWNAGSALDACIASVLPDRSPEGERPEVVLVDNDSADGSTAAARERHPAVRVVETGGNLGFAAGANRGADTARGELLVFLNPDARVVPGALAVLAAALAEHPGVGIAGGGLVGEDGRWEPGAARFPPVRHLLLDTGAGRLGARLRRAPYAVDWVYGTFMAVKRDLFRRLGGFDTRYFLYGEDMDLCFRAARLGERTIHVPAARAVHLANLSARQRFGDGRGAEVVKGEMCFYAARAGRGALRRFRVVAACKFGVKTALAAALGRREDARAYGRMVHACVAFDPGRETVS